MSDSKGTSNKKKENLPHTRRPRAEKTRSLGSILKWSQDTISESYQQSWGYWPWRTQTVTMTVLTAQHPVCFSTLRVPPEG